MPKTKTPPAPAPPTTTRETIRDFLRLPAESLPSADWIGEPGLLAPWSALRDYLRAEDRRLADYAGEKIRLHADRDGWRDGAVVVLG